jgi:predicted transcriptional regulator
MTPAAALETVTPAHSVLDVMGEETANQPPNDALTNQPTNQPTTRDSSEIAELMVAKNFRHVPVADGGAMAGMVSIRDVVHVMLKEHREEVGRLNEYIQGTF